MQMLSDIFHILSVEIQYIFTWLPNLAKHSQKNHDDNALCILDVILPPSRIPLPSLTLPEDKMFLKKTQCKPCFEWQIGKHTWGLGFNFKNPSSPFTTRLLKGQKVQNINLTEIVARVVAQQIHTGHIQEPA